MKKVLLLIFAVVCLTGGGIFIGLELNATRPDDSLLPSSLTAIPTLKGAGDVHGKVVLGREFTRVEQKLNGLGFGLDQSHKILIGR